MDIKRSVHHDFLKLFGQNVVPRDVPAVGIVPIENHAGHSLPVSDLGIVYA
jgi:hypothetical protein